MKRLFFLVLTTTLCCQAFGAEKEVKIIVRNDSEIDRTEEIVELDFQAISQKLKTDKSREVIIIDSEGKQLPYQLTNNNRNIIFPATVKSRQSASYIIKEGSPDLFTKKTFGFFVPERKDDYAWENDRIAFRVYGPALEAGGELSNGIDVWLKRTSNLVIKQRYEDNQSGKQSYHNDNGNGMDNYAVGRTLGAGAAAPFVNDSLWLSKNFVAYEILDSGALRTTVRLKYAPFEVDGKIIAETRTISLDAGSQLNHITVKYTNDENIPVAVGIVKVKTKDEININKQKGYIAYGLTTTDGDGQTFVGIVMTTPVIDAKDDKGHLMTITDVSPKSELSYYAGAGWSKWGFSEFSDWVNYIDQFSERINKPLKVFVK